MKRLSATLLLSALAIGSFTTVPASAQEQEQKQEQADTIIIATSVQSTDTISATTSETTGQWIVRKVGINDNTDRSPSLDRDNDRSSNTPKRWRWRDGHWAGVSIYYSGLMQNLGHMSLPSDASFMRQTPKSIGVSINFVDLTLVSNRNFGLITGLGLEVNNFRFDRNIGLTQNADGYIVADNSYDQDGISLTKSKLTTTYLNIPLLVEFQFGRTKTYRRKPGFVNFGVIAGVRLESHTKVQSKDFTGTDTHKEKRGLNLRNFHYGVEFNIGYRCVALSARYYPQSIFTKDGGPKVQQANVGISFLF